MKTETLEMIIEELASALALERWQNEQRQNEIIKLRKEIVELKVKELGNG